MMMMRLMITIMKVIRTMNIVMIDDGKHTLHSLSYPVLSHVRYILSQHVRVMCAHVRGMCESECRSRLGRPHRSNSESSVDFPVGTSSNGLAMVRS